MIPSGGFFKSVNGRSTMLFRHCLTTLLQRTDYRNLEIVLVDGGEFTDEQLLEFKNIVEASLGPNRWVHCRDSRPYSYSLRMNLAASSASGKYLLQLNDDTELLELLSGDGDLPSDQVEEDCLKGDLRNQLSQKSKNSSVS